MNNAERRLIIDKFLGAHVELSAVKHIPEGKRALELLERYLTEHHKTLLNHTQVYHTFANLADFLAVLELTLPIEIETHDMLDSIPRVQQIQVAIQEARRKFAEHDNLARYGEAHGLTMNQRILARKEAEDVKKGYAYRAYDCLEKLEQFMAPVAEV